MTFKESIELNQRARREAHAGAEGRQHQDRVDAIFGSQEQYAQKFIDEFKAAGVNPQDVLAQSFNMDDVLYWIEQRARVRQAGGLSRRHRPHRHPPIPRLTLDELRAASNRA